MTERKGVDPFLFLDETENIIIFLEVMKHKNIIIFFNRAARSRTNVRAAGIKNFYKKVLTFDLLYALIYIELRITLNLTENKVCWGVTNATAKSRESQDDHIRRWRYIKWQTIKSHLP